jgi:hypothetical protein
MRPGSRIRAFFAWRITGLEQVAAKRNPPFAESGMI